VRTRIAVGPVLNACYQFGRLKAATFCGVIKIKTDKSLSVNASPGSWSRQRCKEEERKIHISIKRKDSLANAMHWLKLGFINYIKKNRELKKRNRNTKYL